MRKVETIHSTKQPRRPHYIEDWAEKRGLSQAELAAAINVDKSLISRWYKGSSPNEESQEKLAAFFHIEREALFRHPDEDWIARFFQGRAQEEVERIKATLEAAFPRKAG
jgi:transcriptional regulator with XRE-family HTH domain